MNQICSVLLSIAVFAPPIANSGEFRFRVGETFHYFVDSVFNYRATIEVLPSENEELVFRATVENSSQTKKLYVLQGWSNSTLSQSTRATRDKYEDNVAEKRDTIVFHDDLGVIRRTRYRMEGSEEGRSSFKGEVPLEPGTLDVLSFLYYVREVDFPSSNTLFVNVAMAKLKTYAKVKLTKKKK